MSRIGRDSSSPVRKKRKSTSEKDIISNLPSEIKLRILSHLKTKEAGRTSVLSHTWRQQWSTIPSLEFDLRKHSHRPWQVTSALLLHDAPIHSFTIRSDNPHDSYSFDTWIRHLSRKRINDFTLKSHSHRDGHGQSLCNVSSALFSCKDLTHLTLKNCCLTLPSSFKGFKKLKSLDLHSITVVQNDLEKLMATSPLLERLSLQKLDGDMKRLKIDAPNLQFLELRGEVQHDIDLTKTLDLVHHVSLEPILAYAKWDRLLRITPAFRELEISCDDFKISVDIEDEETMTSWSFPNIQRLKITRFQPTKYDLNFIKLLYLSCPNLQDLQVASSYPEPCHGEESGLYSFHLSYNASRQILKATGLYGHIFELELIKFLLLSSPLQELHMLFDEDSIDRSRSVWRMKYVFDKDYDYATTRNREGDLELNQLRVTNIRGFSREKDEVGFIEFVVRHSPRLEELTMQPRSGNMPWEVTKLLNEVKIKVNVKLLDPLEPSDEKQSPDNYSGYESYERYDEKENRRIRRIRRRRIRRRRIRRRRMRSPVSSSSSDLSDSSDIDMDSDWDD